MGNAVAVALGVDDNDFDVHVLALVARVLLQGDDVLCPNRVDRDLDVYGDRRSIRHFHKMGYYTH